MTTTAVTTQGTEPEPMPPHLGRLLDGLDGMIAQAEASRLSLIPSNTRLGEVSNSMKQVKHPLLTEIEQVCESSVVDIREVLSPPADSRH